MQRREFFAGSGGWALGTLVMSHAAQGALQPKTEGGIDWYNVQDWGVVRAS